MPLPGHGSTRERFERLAAVAEQDLAMARLVEGDADARAILAESGRTDADDEVTYGVWAARSPSAELRATPTTEGWLLRGTKAFCSGSGVTDRALVTAEAPDGYRLFDVATGPGLLAGRGDGRFGQRDTGLRQCGTSGVQRGGTTRVLHGPARLLVRGLRRRRLLVRRGAGTGRHGRASARSGSGPARAGRSGPPVRRVVGDAPTADRCRCGHRCRSRRPLGPGP